MVKYNTIVPLKGFYSKSLAEGVARGELVFLSDNISDEPGVSVSYRIRFKRTLFIHSANENYSTNEMLIRTCLNE